VKNVFTANELLFRIADQTASCYCQAAASARNIPPAGLPSPWSKPCGCDVPQAMKN
jgi:hypothetical protein